MCANISIENDEQIVCRGKGVYFRLECNNGGQRNAYGAAADPLYLRQPADQGRVYREYVSAGSLYI